MTECVRQSGNCGTCAGCEEAAAATPRCCLPDCDTIIPNTSQLPVCRGCGIKIALIHQFDASMLNAVHAEQRRIEQEQEDAAESVRQRDSWVYYVDLGQHIKIGYTSNLRARLASLRAHPSELLAIEPGGRNVEKARHHMFRAIRLDAREHFAPTPELLTWIAKKREQFDLPAWANVPAPGVRISRVGS